MTSSPARAPDSAWSLLVEAIGSDRESLDIAAARIGQLPSYRTIPVEDLVPEIRRDFAVAFTGLRDRRMPGANEDVRAYEKTGEHRARQGVTLADMLHGWNIGMEVARAGAYRVTPPSEHREALLLEAIEIMTAWNTLGMNAAAEAHRRVELELALQEQHDLANLVRRVLYGTAGLIARQGHLESYGIDPTAEYYAVRARPDDPVDLGSIEAWLGAGESAERRNGLVALIDGDVVGFVATLPEECDLPLCVGVAGPATLPKLADAFRLASRAVETAHALRRRGVVELSTLGLAPAVLADHDVGNGVLERYVTPVERRGRSGAAILDTVERYLANDLQVDATAAELQVHPNTVRYRVGRFERLTGSSLKHNESLVEVWWALRRREVAAEAAR
jgi:PucR-like helix-turn-helix protein